MGNQYKVDITFMNMKYYKSYILSMIFICKCLYTVCFWNMKYVEKIILMDEQTFVNNFLVYFCK